RFSHESGGSTGDPARVSEAFTERRACPARMKEVLYILLSAALVYYSSLAAGRLLFRLLKIELYAQEERFHAFTAGAGILSIAIFLLSAVRLARKSAFLVVGIAMIAARWKYLRGARPPELPPEPPPWSIAFRLFYAVFGAVYLVNAL